MAEKEIDLKFDGFWRRPINGGLPNKSGIYCIYAFIYDRKVSIQRLLYIGESDNIRERVKNHEKWNDWEAELNSKEVICISRATVPDDLKKRAEAALIYKHKPPVNTEYVDSFPFDKTKISTSGKNNLLSSSFIVNSDN